MSLVSVLSPSHALFGSVSPRYTLKPMPDEPKPLEKAVGKGFKGKLPLAINTDQAAANSRTYGLMVQSPVKIAAEEDRGSDIILSNSPLEDSSPSLQERPAFVLAEAMSRAVEEAILHPPAALAAEAAILLHRLRTDRTISDDYVFSKECKAPLVYLLNTDLQLDRQNMSGYADCFGWTKGHGVWYLQGTRESHKLQSEICRSNPGISYLEMLRKAGATFYTHYNDHPATQAAMALAKERGIRNAAVRACAKIPHAPPRVWRGSKAPEDRFLFAEELGIVYLKGNTALFHHIAKTYPQLHDESRLENTVRSPHFSPGLQRNFPALTDLEKARRDYESARRRRRAERAELGRPAPLMLTQTPTSSLLSPSFLPGSLPCTPRVKGANSRRPAAARAQTVQPQASASPLRETRRTPTKQAEIQLDSPKLEKKIVSPLRKCSSMPSFAVVGQHASS